MAEALRGRGRVLWVEPTPARLPRFADITRPHSARHERVDGHAGIEVVATRLLPLEPLPLLRGVNNRSIRSVVRAIAQFTRDIDLVIAGKPTRLALAVCDALPHARLIYDAMDDFAAFFDGMASRHVAQVESTLVRRADEVWVTAQSLHARHEGVASRIRLVPNACAVERVPRADTRRERLNGARFVYIGTIGEWFDWAFLQELAQAVPEGTIEMIGPVYHPPPQALPDNVLLAGELPHSAAMARMAVADAGLIPFLRNRLTDAVDPLKYYEYRAAGLPVISTDFGSMRSRGEGDFVFKPTGTGMRATVERAVLTRVPTGITDAFRAENDWSNRFQGLF